MNEALKLVPLATTSLVVTCARDIKPEKVHWLWQDRFPLGKCTLIAGEGGLGKSMVLAWMAATVSRGREWPCQEGQSPCGSVIIFSAEDDAADTIVPRLMAADANCSKVHIVSAVLREDEKGHRSFNLQLDLPELEKKIEELGDVLLVIIDPITSYLGKVDSHRNAELRSVLEPLGEMAARLGVTVIANTHLSKATGGSANSRVIGSVAFVNHARATFIVTADPEDNGRRLFIPSKSNLGRPREGFAYRIVDTTIQAGDGELIWAPYVKWEDSTVAMGADEAVAAMTGDVESRGAKEEAKDFLLQVLSEGPIASKEVKRQAEEAGISIPSLRRAQRALGVEVRREGGIAEKGQWLWCLRCSPQNLSTLDTLGDFRHFPGDQPAKVLKPESEHLSNNDTYIDREERAAILEYDDGLTRAEAEARAAAEMPDLPKFLDRRAARGA